MKRVALLGLAGGLALAVTGCGSSTPSQTSLLQRSGALIEPAPVVTTSPTVFVAGATATETLPTGQRVTMTVNGPLLTNPIAGHKVQFADIITETFTVTATTTSQTPVIFALADFALKRFNTADAILKGPAQVVLRAGAPETWRLALDQTPGQGYFTWRYNGVAIANWSYVAEND